MRPHQVTRCNFGEKTSRDFLALRSLQNKLFVLPRRTAAVERIFSIAGYILSQRRTRITDDNIQNQLFANVNSDLPEVPDKKLRLEK